MIAMVKQNKYYLSYVFALIKVEPKVFAIVFNAKDNEFVFISVYETKYSLNQNVSLIDDKIEGLIEIKEIELVSFKATECLGYAWLLNNSKLLNAIILGDEVDKKYKDLAKKMNSKISIDKWHRVTNEKAADELLDIVGGFHDSYIKEIKYIGSSVDPKFLTKIQVTFELAGNYDVALEFEGNITIHYSFCSYINSIYLASIVFGDNTIYWVEGEDDYRLCDIKDNSSYFQAEKLRWKLLFK